MPFNVDIFVQDRDDGQFIICIDRELITERGAQIMQQILTANIANWRRLDDMMVRTVLRAVTG